LAASDVASKLDIAFSPIGQPGTYLTEKEAMPVFAVTYLYAATPEQLNEIRPIHRQWLAGLLESGQLLASGPMIDNPESLLIFHSESATELASLLDNDPFDIAGFIGSRSIQQWNPVFGPFSSS
jgi:uncharacterized protein YciI